MQNAHAQLCFSDLVGQAVMRGCMDRLLLFGMDVDIKDAITSRHYGCKTMDRHLIQLVPLHKEIPLVRAFEKKKSCRYPFILSFNCALGKVHCLRRVLGPSVHMYGLYVQQSRCSIRFRFVQQTFTRDCYCVDVSCECN